MKKFTDIIKRTIVILLASILILNGTCNGFTTITADAATTTITTTSTSELKVLLAKLMTTGNSSTYNISQYRLLPMSFITTFYAVAQQQAVAYYSYYDLSYEYTLDSNGYVATFHLKNVDSGFVTRYAKMQAAVNAVLSGMDSDMTNLEKLVYVHDYLAYNMQYDKSAVTPNVSYYPYGVMVNKTGVCDSYSKALMMFMNLFGIPCNYVISTQMNHSWVSVKIGNYYYNVDVTWDDPTKDTLGRVYHEFLLRTDSEFESSLSAAHYGWSKFAATADNTYSNWEIHNVKSRIIYSNGDWYYIDSTNSLVKSDIMCSNKTVLIKGGTSYSEALNTLEPFNGGWLYTQGAKVMYCDYNGNNQCEVLDLASTSGDQSKVCYLYAANNALTCTTYTYIDAFDESTFISKISTEYSLYDILMKIDKNTQPLPTTTPLVSIEPVTTDSALETAAGSGANSDISDTVTSTGSISSTPAPATYTAIDYINISANNNGIDTGYFANGNTSISLDMAVTSTSNYANYVNGYTSSNNRLIFRQEASNGLYVAYGWYNSCVYKPQASTKFNISQLGTQTYINGKLVRTATKQSYQMTSSLKIGTAKCNLYECKIWDNNILVRDFIPVLDSKNVACLYDTVNNKFYYSNTAYTAGTVTPSASPVATATPVPSASPAATATPVPSASPEATATPVPSALPEVTATPVPSALPEATATPVPTVLPEATASTEIINTTSTNTECAYTALSYIEATGNNNRIDTNYLANNNTSISLDMAFTDNSNYGNIVSGFDTNSNRLVFRQESSNGLYVAYGWYNSCVYKPTVSEKFNISQLGSVTYVNGVSVRTATSQTYQMTQTLKLATSKCRIYGCKIWDKDQLIREYIPVLDSNGTACLYDKITSTFFYGISSFTFNTQL